MKFINKLERKFGKYAIRNLSLVMIIGYVIGYGFNMLGVLEFFTLNPALVMKGQIWRLFTWVITPPEDLGIFTIIMLFFYYSLGTSLENTWGTFRYNLYIFSGILFTAVGTLIMYGISVVLNTPIYGSVSTYYLCMSIFLAFAMEYPNMQIYLYMIIPVKVKWMAYIDIAFLTYSFVLSGWIGRTMIITSLLNFIVVFLATRNYRKISPTEIKRKQRYKQQIKVAQATVGHKCTICGQTPEDNPDLQFRYCSRCNGNYEYCQNHLFTHEHVK